MAYFQQTRPTQRVILPSNKNFWVDIYKKFSWKEEKAIGLARMDGTVPADALLNAMIIDWNLEDENGIASIDKDHIDGMDRDDALAILGAINGIMVASEDTTETKKASPKKSPKR